MEFINVLIFMALIYIAMTLRAIEKHYRLVSQTTAERDVKILKEIETINFRVNKLRQD